MLARGRSTGRRTRRAQRTVDAPGTGMCGGPQCFPSRARRGCRGWRPIAGHHHRLGPWTRACLGRRAIRGGRQASHSTSAAARPRSDIGAKGCSNGRDIGLGETLPVRLFRRRMRGALIELSGRRRAWGCSDLRQSWRDVGTLSASCRRGWMGGGLATLSLLGTIVRHRGRRALRR